MNMKIQGGQKATVWFIVGFLVVATVVTIVAAVVSSGSLEGPSGRSDIPAPPVTDSDWAVGPRDAKVTLIEYADFQCPACKSYHPMVKRLLAEYGDRILFVSRNFPLYSIHPNAGISAQAVEAAGLQGKYWEMYDILFERQGEWASTRTNQVVERHFNGYAEEIGLDLERFGEDINSDQVLRRIEADVDSARDVGVNSTPTFYMNLQQIQNPRSYDEFKSIIDNALAAP